MKKKGDNPPFHRIKSAGMAFSGQVISVIIPTHRRAVRVEGLIHSLRDQDFPAENLQVLLISNLKDKRLRRKAPEWRGDFYDFKYMETGEVGVNRARNLGIRFAGGDILYFLDDDCLPPSKDHLMKLLARHQKEAQAVGIGGGYKTQYILKGPGRAYHEGQQKWMTAVSKSLFGTKQLVGGNASYKREVFDRGFAFDSRIVFGGSEESFNRLLTDNGYRLMLFRDLDVYHVIHVNTLTLAKKGFRQGTGHFRNQKKTDRGVDMKKQAAFIPPFVADRMTAVYHLFFKLGYFWAGSSEKVKGFVFFRLFYFLFLILKSRWVVIKDHIILGVLWKYAGVLWKYAGGVWFYFGSFYGLLVRLYYLSPPAKVWYFCKYQFLKRVWSKRWKNKNPNSTG